jgi:hypothetical protein
VRGSGEVYFGIPRGRVSDGGEGVDWIEMGEVDVPLVEEDLMGVGSSDDPGEAFCLLGVSRQSQSSDTDLKEDSAKTTRPSQAGTLPSKSSAILLGDVILAGKGLVSLTLSGVDLYIVEVCKARKLLASARIPRHRDKILDISFSCDGSQTTVVAGSCRSLDVSIKQLETIVDCRGTQSRRT